MTNTIQPNTESLRQLADNPNQEPVVMLNLLKFKGEEGKNSYFRYTKEAGKFVEKVGGKVIYLGIAQEMIYGKEPWDAVMLVQYPSRSAFLQMANDPEYLKAHTLREEGLDRAVLYATDPIKFKDLAAK